MNKECKYFSFIVIAISFVLNIVPAISCNVPVFRYALERWPADLYEVVVYHRGPLSEKDAPVLDRLEKSSSKSVSYANFRVISADLSSDIPPELQSLWETLDEPALPCLVLCYPKNILYRGSIWSGPLTMESVKALVDSPARQQIARGIIEGDSAVWVLVESGDSAKDDTAARMIQTQLSNLENTLTLPDAVQGNQSSSPVDVSQGLDVHIAFSIVRVSRDNPAESIFIAMLMHSESDLYDYTSYPMTFPVFGRGRALYALIDEGITERNMQAAGMFLTGACSCEVKALNPGIDILITADWEKGIYESWIQEEDLPPLVGLSELVQAVDTSESISRSTG